MAITLPTALSLPSLTAYKLDTGSKWKFKTNATGSISLELVTAGGGQITLIDPQGKEQNLNFGGAGVGVSIGIKLPKLGRVKIPLPKNAPVPSGGTNDFPSVGKVLKHANDAELTREDFKGLCIFEEASCAIAGGGYMMALFANLNPALLPLASNAIGMQVLLNSAHAIILMAGLNVGLQAQCGITGSIGYLR